MSLASAAAAAVVVVVVVVVVVAARVAASSPRLPLPSDTREYFGIIIGKQFESLQETIKKSGVTRISIDSDGERFVIVGRAESVEKAKVIIRETIKFADDRKELDREVSE